MGTIAVLSPTDLSIEPGGQATTSIRVRNTGAIVDRFDVDVVGPAAGWVRVEPASLSLFPGAEGVATITFAPPRASMPRAGTIPYGVRVRPEANPAGSTVEEGKVTVSPFGDAVAEVVPQTSRGSRVGRHEVLVANRGNAPVMVAVSASDPDRLLAFEVQPDRAIVGPDERAAFQVTARAGDTFPVGTNRAHPFVVVVEPGRQPPLQLRATLSQRPLLPGWLPPLAGLALAAVAIGVVAFAFGLGPFSPGATPVPSQVAEVSAPPTATPAAEAPSESPSEEVPSEAVPTEPPTRPPLTTDDFSLAVTGDQVQLGSGLAIRCPTNDEGCRDQAIETIRTIVNELANPYSGAGLTSTRLLDVPQTLPVVLDADALFPWRNLDGSEADVTERAVIDLGPILAEPRTLVYAVVESQGGQVTRRFVVDQGIANQLFQLLYTVPPQMGDMTPATPPPDVSINEVVRVDSINWNVLWVLASPSP